MAASVKLCTGVATRDMFDNKTGGKELIFLILFLSTVKIHAHKAIVACNPSREIHSV